jgi:transposase
MARTRDTRGTGAHTSQRRYPPELKERAVRMVLDSYERGEERFGTVTRIATELGIGPESLRKWVHQAEVDRGRRAGTTTEDARRIAELERENRELRRANEILKSASAFFAAELDRPSKR